MHKTLALLLFSLVISTATFAQERMNLINKKTLPATNTWSFLNDSYSYDGIVDVQIGNNGKGGTLLLQVKVSDPSFYIGGNAYLFLENGNVITCTDKNLKSHSGTMAEAYYLLTPGEIQLLKKTKITDVLFKINGKATPFSSPTGFFTAHNKIRDYALPDATYDTVAAIHQLFR